MCKVYDGHAIQIYKKKNLISNRLSISMEFIWLAEFTPTPNVEVKKSTRILIYRENSDNFFSVVLC